MAHICAHIPAHTHTCVCTHRLHDLDKAPPDTGSLSCPSQVCAEPTMSPKNSGGPAAGLLWEQAGI